MNKQSHTEGRHSVPGETDPEKTKVNDDAVYQASGIQWVDIDPVKTDTIAAKRAKQIMNHYPREDGEAEEFKTFFIQGTWGSGKTHFLDAMKKSETMKNVKIIDLALWETQDERSVIERTYAEFHPWYYQIQKRVNTTITIVTSAIFSSFGVHLLFQDGMNHVQLIVLIVVIVMSLWLKETLPNSDAPFVNGLKNEQLGAFPNTILLFDDFDRVTSEDVQNQAYKLFNVLKGKLPIVFIGDIKMIANANGNFLGKIIDEKISLPYQFNAADSWTKAVDNIYRRVAELTENSLEEGEGVMVSNSDGSNKKMTLADIKRDFVDIAIVEERTLRDLVQFGRAVDQYYFETGKYEITNIRDQLILLYLYVFYPVVYDCPKVAPNVADLLNILKENTTEDVYETVSNDNQISQNILRKISALLSQTKGYPDGFSINPLGYFVFEDGSLLNGVQLKSLMQDENEVLNLLSSRDEASLITTNKQDQVSTYIVKQQRKDGDFIESHKLLEKVIRFANEGKYNRLSKTIGRVYSRSILGKDKPSSLTSSEKQKLWSTWTEHLEKERITDLSKQIYILRVLDAFPTLADFPEDVNIYPEKIDPSKDDFADQQLSLFLYHNNLQKDAKWDDYDFIWPLIEKLKPEPYIRFWADMNLIAVRELSKFMSTTDVIGDNPNWVLVTGNRSKDSSGIIAHRPLAIARIKRHIAAHKKDFEKFRIKEVSDTDSMKSMAKLNLYDIDTIQMQLKPKDTTVFLWLKDAKVAVKIFAPKDLAEPLSVDMSYYDIDEDEEFAIDFGDSKNIGLLSSLSKQYKQDYGYDVDFKALVNKKHDSL